MVASSLQDGAAQASALEDYYRRLPAVIDDVSACGDQALREAALADLLGLDLRIDAQPGAAAGKVTVHATASCRSRDEVPAEIALHVLPSSVPFSPEASVLFRVSASARGKAAWALDIPNRGQAPVAVMVEARFECYGRTVCLSRKTSFYPSIGRGWTLWPFDNEGDGTVDTVLPPKPGRSTLIRPTRALAA